MVRPYGTVRLAMVREDSTLVGINLPCKEVLTHPMPGVSDMATDAQATLHGIPEEEEARGTPSAF